MKQYKDYSREELMSLEAELQKQYDEIKAKGLDLNIARGKPGWDQMDLSMPMMDVLSSNVDYLALDGTDVRNYGMLQGIPGARKLMGDVLGADPANVIIFGNSSLNVMYDCVAWAEIFGIMGSTPWSKLDKVKFLCPVPGYDRHFAITEQFGIEMINVPMTQDGPDMDMVEEYVNHDPAVKGIWCVPLYSNPTGAIYSDETVKRFANLKPAAKDFRIFWDNAYAIHHLYEEKQGRILNILEEAEKAGNPDIVYEFASTSKVTFPGAGIACLASSDGNVQDILGKMKYATIGFDKINMLRHARFFKDIDGLKAHMKKHADIVRPKFEAILEAFDKELEGLGIATWTKPIGGYFISFYAMDGCAKEIFRKCKEAGLIMTNAGAAYPYGKDPHDSNIRIAPTMPPLSDVVQAVELFIVCVKLTTVEKLLGK